MCSLLILLKNFCSTMLSARFGMISFYPCSIYIICFIDWYGQISEMLYSFGYYSCSSLTYFVIFTFIVPNTKVNIELYVVWFIFFFFLLFCIYFFSMWRKILNVHPPLKYSYDEVLSYWREKYMYDCC